MFPFAITSCNYVTYRDTSMGCILKRYAAHLLKTHKRSIFITTFQTSFPPLFMYFFTCRNYFSTMKVCLAGLQVKWLENIVLQCISLEATNQKADKTTWPLYSPIRTKKTTFDWGSIFGLRQSIYCKCLCLHCWNAINTLKGFSFLQPNKNTGGLSLVGIVQSFVISAVPPLICNSFAPSGRCVRPIVLVELCMQKATPTESFVSW